MTLQVDFIWKERSLYRIYIYTHEHKHIIYAPLINMWIYTCIIYIYMHLLIFQTHACCHSACMCHCSCACVMCPCPCLFMCMCIHKCACVSLCLYIYMYICSAGLCKSMTSLFMLLYVCVYVCVYMYMCEYMNGAMNIYIYSYVCVYIYTHV